MVRHEAGEALGAICSEECLAPLRRHERDTCQEVAETCQLALQRVEYFKARANDQDDDGSISPFVSVDPTPAAPASTPVQELRETVLDEGARMFDRYRALFALRNRGGTPAAEALTEIFNSSSALLKHEVAYVLGQMLDKSTTEALVQVMPRSPLSILPSLVQTTMVLIRPAPLQGVPGLHPVPVTLFLFQGMLQHHHQLGLWQRNPRAPCSLVWEHYQCLVLL